MTTHDPQDHPFLHVGDDAGFGGSALKCPQCSFGYLHFGRVLIATTHPDAYQVMSSLAIDPTSSSVVGDEEAAQQHGGQNRGPMVSIGYLCESGCIGRIELRYHKGQIYAATVTENRDSSKEIVDNDF